MRVLILFIVFFTTWQFLFSQEQLKTINGIIVVDEDNPEGFDVDGILIQNLGQNTQVFTNLNGRFKIDVAVGDTIWVRSSFFYNRKLKISQRVWDKESVFIHLNEEEILLDEAEINAFNYSGYLEEDIKRLNQPDSVTILYNSLGINPRVLDIEPEQNLALLGFWDVFPLTADLGRVADAISGDLRRRRTEKRYRVFNKEINSVINYLGNDFFVNELGIPKNKIREFVIYSYHKHSLKAKINNQDYLSISLFLDQDRDPFLLRLKEDNLIE